MTPFGEKIQKLRRLRGITQKDMAAALDVSPAYLSALEHGQRGRPQWSMVQRIITYFNVIWDEAEELQHLASISNPKAIVNTADLSANATRLANLLADNIGSLGKSDIDDLISHVELLGRKYNK